MTMTASIPNLTATEALAYIGSVVKARIEIATDAIGGNIPQVNESAESLYDNNEWVLEMLDDLSATVLAAVRPHVEGASKVNVSASANMRPRSRHLRAV